jgi:hypothetical protein
MCRDVWRRAADTVRKPDGSVDDWDVVDRLLTHRSSSPNAQLTEHVRAIRALRKEPLDLARINSEIIEDWEERIRREERREYNKWRYRPRGA